MPLKDTYDIGTEKRPTEAGHIALLTKVAPTEWTGIVPGNVLAAIDGDVQFKMVLTKVKIGGRGLRLQLEVRCCGNAKCTRTMTLEGKWNGVHVNRTGQEFANSKKALTGAKK